LYRFGWVEQERTLQTFRSAAAKNHQDARWVLSVFEGGSWEGLKDRFVQSDRALGWYIGALLANDTEEKFNLVKKSAEADCSWAQVAYGLYFHRAKEGDLVEQNDELYLKWLEKAGDNCSANWRKGLYFSQVENSPEKALNCFRKAGGAGRRDAMEEAANFTKSKNLIGAVILSAKAVNYGPLFWNVLRDAMRAEKTNRKNLDCDFDQLCYFLGWGLFWYRFGTMYWNEDDDEEEDDEMDEKTAAFSHRCLDFYCANVETQQKSLLTFLLFWNQTVGVKDVGRMIGKLVWEDRREHLVTLFKNNRNQKRIKLG
jgi:hypothetical protein